MKTILVVEDDPLIFDFYHELLVEHGYQVLPAFNGNEAMEQLQHRPDLVILDMLLPKIHGRSILLHIKKVARNLPVIISTSKIGMQDDPEIRLSNQVKRFLHKPVAPDKFLEAVHQVIAENAHKNLEGKTIQGCYLQQFIEAGSSGAVYKAIRQETVVAVKFLSLKLEYQGINSAEAEILCTMEHPNIIHIFEMGIAEEMPFIVMEYVEAETVHKLLQKQGWISLAEACYIIQHVAEGMELSHTKRLLHRDLKPSNILYNRSTNCVKIIDFGIARLMDSSGNAEVIGSPYYMSPEQCQGFALNPMSDIYSLGVTFFQMITGIVPFDRANAVETMLAHIQAPIEWPQKLVQPIPDSVKNILNKMMAKEPNSRYLSMKQVSLALQEVQVN